MPVSATANSTTWDSIKYNLTWGKYSWNPEKEIPDLSGKVAMITGPTAGIGLVSVEELVKKKAKVYLLARSESKAKSVIRDIEKKIPAAEGLLKFIPFDLTDVKSAKAAAAQFLTKETRLDILINNAGIMAWPYEIKNGVEIQFSNHIGHFALTLPLLPILAATAELPGAHVRIVNVSSVGNNLSPPPDFSSIETANQKFANPWERYGQSKLANIIFTQGLAKHLKGTGVRSLAIHPGVVNTDLTRGFESTYPTFGRIFQALYAFAGVSIPAFDGAKTQLWAATSPEVDAHDYDGQFFYPVGVEFLPKGIIADSDNKYVDQLWSLSEKVVA